MRAGIFAYHMLRTLTYLLSFPGKFPGVTVLCLSRTWRIGSSLFSAWAPAGITRRVLSLSERACENKPSDVFFFIYRPNGNPPRVHYTYIPRKTREPMFSTRVRSLDSFFLLLSFCRQSVGGSIFYEPGYFDIPFDEIVLYRRLEETEGDCSSNNNNNQVDDVRVSKSGLTNSAGECKAEITLVLVHYPSLIRC